MLRQAFTLQSSSATPVRPVRPVRWVALLAASMLLHWFVLSMTTHGLGSVTPAQAPVAQVVTATLRAMPPRTSEPPSTPVVTAPPPLPPKPAPVKRAVRTKPATPTAPIKSPASNNPVVASVPGPADAAALPAEAAVPASTGDNVLQAGADPAPLPTAQAAPKPAAPASPGDTPARDSAPRYTVSLPPPVTLEYEVRYSTRGSITRGSSKIDWQPGDGAYAIRGEVSKFGFALSSFRSEGAIDDAGIAPTLYAEKNARRSETNTHFQRKADPVISFSAATDTFPLLTGAQDRASILWQLSGIARGDRKAFVPGAVLDVFVAGVRDAEHWLVNIVGEEAVTLDTGEVRAWHLVRTPRPGTYDKRIDIWLAPEQQWYPVKLRYTEVNGDYLDLSLSALRPVGVR